MFLHRKRSKAQSIIEFAMMIAVVIAALMTMRVYAKRAFSGKLKEGSDRIGQQFSPRGHNYTWTTYSNSTSHEKVSGSGKTETTEMEQFSNRTGNEDFSGYGSEKLWDGND